MGGGVRAKARTTALRTTYRDKRVTEQEEEKINRMITHILRFPPGARVTLTNRRLYCALFPVLLVLFSLPRSRRLDGWMAFREWGVYGTSTVPVNDRYSKFHLLPPSLLVRSRAFPNHFDPTRSPWLLCPKTICSNIESGGDLDSQYRYCLVDSFSIQRSNRLPIRPIAIHPSTPQKVSLTCSSLGLLLLLLLLYFRTLFH